MLLLVRGLDSGFKNMKSRRCICNGDKSKSTDKEAYSASMCEAVSGAGIQKVNHGGDY